MIHKKCKPGTLWCNLRCSSVSKGICSLGPGSVQPIFSCSAEAQLPLCQRSRDDNYIYCFDQRSWHHGPTLRSGLKIRDKPLNLIQNLFKPRLESGGQVGPVLLRTCITEFSICWCFPAAESMCPCIALLEPIQEVIEVSVVTSIDSFESLVFEGESSADHFLRTVSENPWMGWGKKAK